LRTVHAGVVGYGSAYFTLRAPISETTTLVEAHSNREDLYAYELKPVFPTLARQVTGSY